MSQKESWVFAHCEDISNGNYKCKVCQSTLQIEKDDEPLKLLDHFRNEHSDLHNELNGQDNLIEDPGDDEEWEDVEEDEEEGPDSATAKKALLKWFCSSLLSLDSLEPLLGIFKATAAKVSVPTMTEFTALMDTCYNNCMDKIKADLKSTTHVSLSMDCWKTEAVGGHYWSTEQYEDEKDYTTFTVHLIGEDFQLKAYLLESYMFPCFYLEELIEKLYKDWDAVKGKVVAITTDYKPAKIKAVKRIPGDMPHVHCASHRLNSVQLKIIREVNELRKKVIPIGLKFLNDTVAKQRLEGLQRQHGEYVQPVDDEDEDEDTEWIVCEIQDFHNIILMFRSIVRTEKSLRACLAAHYPKIANLTEEDISTLKECLEVLSVFQQVTKEMSDSKDTMSIAEVLVIYNSIMKLLEEKTCMTTEGKVLLEIAKEEMLAQFGPLDSEQLYAFATLLDPRYKTAQFRDAEKAQEMVEKLKRMVTPANGVEGKKADQPDSSVDDSKETTTAWNTEVKKYFDAPVLDGNPYKWWQENQSAFPGLYKLAMRHLCIAANSVPPGSLFTEMGKESLTQRKRLNGEYVTKQVFLGANSDLI